MHDELSFLVFLKHCKFIIIVIDEKVVTKSRSQLARTIPQISVVGGHGSKRPTPHEEESQQRFSFNYSDNKEYYDFDFSRYQYYYSFPEDHVSLSTPAHQKKFINAFIEKNCEDFTPLYLDSQKSNWDHI